MPLPFAAVCDCAHVYLRTATSWCAWRGRRQLWVPALLRAVTLKIMHARTPSARAICALVGRPRAGAWPRSGARAWRAWGWWAWCWRCGRWLGVGRAAGGPGGQRKEICERGLALEPPHRLRHSCTGMGLRAPSLTSSLLAKRSHHRLRTNHLTLMHAATATVAMSDARGDPGACMHHVGRGHEGRLEGIREGCNLVAAPAGAPGAAQ